MYSKSNKNCIRSSVFGSYVFASSISEIIGYKALLLLLGNPLIDSVYVNMDEGSAYIQNLNGKLEPVVGWMKISDTNLVFQNIKDFNL